MLAEAYWITQQDNKHKNFNKQKESQIITLNL